MKTGVVPRFEGEYFFLSNFYESPFEWRSHQFPTAEHAFQASKAYAMSDARLPDMTSYMNSVVLAETPKRAKHLGRIVPLDVKEWERIKVQYMREIVHAKFAQCQGLAGQLINTGAMMLVEGNTWGDKFWGRCLDKDTGKMVGLNTLGAILMEERGYWLHSDFGDKK